MVNYYQCLVCKGGVEIVFILTQLVVPLLENRESLILFE